jgi:hypothetical protein
MAIISRATVQTYSTLTYSGADATSIEALCTAVDVAIKRLLRPYYPEPLTVTDTILDAPPSRELLLPLRPARSITSVYHHPGADGNASLFTADDLLDATEYQLVIDPDTGHNGAGILRRVDRIWGHNYHSPLDRLGYEIESDRGALKVTYAAGPAAVPKDIEYAAALAVQLLFEYRKTGIPLTSESWNGYSINNAQPFTTEEVLKSPRVWGLLAPYASTIKLGGW